MKLLIGLGNPGKTYATTRHNAGFLVCDQLIQRHPFTTFLMNQKFDAEIAQGRWNKWQMMIIKPQLFMNRSGISVQKVMQFYQVPSEQILIIHDEIDLPFGQMRLKFNGGDGGHNGIRDIFHQTGSKRFRRLKIGVGRPEHPEHEMVDRVLSKFTSEELSALGSEGRTIDLRIEEFMRNSG